MEQIGIKPTEGKHYLAGFKHKHFLLIPNLSKIISLQMESNPTHFGEKGNRGQSYIWGGYHYCLYYSTLSKKEITKEKFISRPFLFNLETIPEILVRNNAANEPENIFCETSHDYCVTPLFLSLFPLLNKLKFVPYKIDITVHGKIYFATTESRVAFQKGIIEGKELGIQQSFEEKNVEEVTFREGVFEEGRSEIGVVGEEISKLKKKEDQDIKEPKKKEGAFPDAKYYQTYKFFYDQLLNRLEKHG
jgi:hypothetical protein